VFTRQLIHPNSVDFELKKKLPDFYMRFKQAAKIFKRFLNCHLFSMGPHPLGIFFFNFKNFFLFGGFENLVNLSKILAIYFQFLFFVKLEILQNFPKKLLLVFVFFQNL